MIVLQETWALSDGRVVARGDAPQINKLLAENLVKVTTHSLSGGWRILYQHNETGKLWELGYPNGGIHGGGLRRSRELDLADSTNWRHYVAGATAFKGPAHLRAVLDDAREMDRAFIAFANEGRLALPQRPNRPQRAPVLSDSTSPQVSHPNGPEEPRPSQRKSVLDRLWYWLR